MLGVAGQSRLCPDAMARSRSLTAGKYPSPQAEGVGESCEVVKLVRGHRQGRAEEEWIGGMGGYRGST